MASKTLSWTFRSDMVLPTRSVATDTHVGGPPTSLAMQFGLRKTQDCFTNLHKPKHLVLAVLFSISSSPCTNTYNGHSFFNHSFSKWLQAKSGDLDSVTQQQQSPFKGQIQILKHAMDFSTTSLDDTGEFYIDFDWSCSEMAQTNYVQSFSSHESVLAAPWQSTDFLVQRPVPHNFKDLRIAKHVLESAIVAQIFACHLIGMRMGDVPIFKAKENREQRQLIHRPHVHTGIFPLFIDCVRQRNVGCNTSAVGQFVACMRWPYFCTFHDFLPYVFAEVIGFRQC